MFHGHGLWPAVFSVNVNGFAAVIMALLHVAILAFSAHEQDVRKRAALFTLAHYYKLRSNRQNASIRRAKRMRVVQQILCWFIRQTFLMALTKMLLLYSITCAHYAMISILLTLMDLFGCRSRWVSLGLVAGSWRRTQKSSKLESSRAQ